MHTRRLALLLMLSLGAPAFASTSQTDLASLARRAASADGGEAAAAIQALRAAGPAGLDAFIASHREAIQARRAQIASADSLAASVSWPRISAAMDAIARQKDSFASGLFWYTDFDQARAAARASGKPILSLRLLGRLDEELSCANSRFFRLTLYANPRIAQMLKERYILHWQTVRPAPKVTIDFGDGRRLERTLTGNSIHYVLNPQGRVIDALPGLYGPQAFLKQLARTENVAVQSMHLPTNEMRAAALRDYHNLRLQEIAQQWANDKARAGVTFNAKAATSAGADVAKPPRAEVAARAAITKMLVVERPLLRGISSEPRLLDAQPEDAGWARLASWHADEATLDAASRALVRSKNPARFADADEWQRTLTALERTIAIDTVRNEYLFHATLYEWLAKAGAAVDLAALNERVYAELFLTPSSDQWLGLLPDGGFTGIENDGVRK